MATAPRPGPEDPHLVAVKAGTKRLLDQFGDLEDDLLDGDERTTARISLLNADVLGNVLAALYVTHRDLLGPAAAEEWLAEVLQVFGKVVQKRYVTAPVDFDSLKATAARLWATTHVIPDALPDDLR